MTRIGRRLRQAACLLSAPSTVAHELTHFAVARVRTTEAAIEVAVFDGRAVAVWTPLDSRVWRALAFLGPTLFGCLLGLIWLVSGVSMEGWRLIAAIGLGLYTMPSGADVRGACGLQLEEDDQ
jgi:hypothetical protein